MSDADLARLLSELQTNVAMLNAESDSVTEILESVESQLVAMKAGLESWLEHPPIESHVTTEYAEAHGDEVDRNVKRQTELGYAKVAGTWRLAVRVERCVVDDEWSHEIGPRPLLGASREVRIAALPLIPDLLRIVSKRTEAALKNIAEAKKLVKAN